VLACWQACDGDFTLNGSYWTASVHGSLGSYAAVGPPSLSTYITTRGSSHSAKAGGLDTSDRSSDRCTDKTDSIISNCLKLALSQLPRMTGDTNFPVPQKIRKANGQRAASSTLRAATLTHFSPAAVKVWTGYEAHLRSCVHHRMVRSHLVCPRRFPYVQAETTSAFVWGEDFPRGAISSSITDPLTVVTIPKLTYAGIEVSSRMGFERIGHAEAGAFLGSTTTVVNGTEHTISVQWGGISIDGHQASLLSVVPDHNRSRHSNSDPNVFQVSKLYCFRSSFLSNENLFREGTSLNDLLLDPQKSLSVSSIVRSPQLLGSLLDRRLSPGRNNSLLCQGK